MGNYKIRFQIATIVLLLSCTANGHRILGLFPHPGISHYQFFHPVMKALAEAGHEVTVVSHFPTKEVIENYRDEPLTWKGGDDGLKNFVNLDVSSTFFLIFPLIVSSGFYSGSTTQNLMTIC